MDRTQLDSLRLFPCLDDIPREPTTLADVAHLQRLLHLSGRILTAISLYVDARTLSGDQRSDLRDTAIAVKVAAGSVLRRLS